MVVFQVQDTDEDVLQKTAKQRNYKLPVKSTAIVPAEKKVISKYEDKTSFKLEDMVPEHELKKLNGAKTEGYIVRKLLALKLNAAMEDDFIDSSKKAIKNLRKFLKQTAEGQELIAAINNLKTAEKNKAHFKRLENDLKGDAKNLGVDLKKHTILTGIKMLSDNNI